ncbi:c-type cytochrome [Mucilaginibacter terrenus]|uniref:c-type cytochrome n=1 Tax=Mucilaginibacter terrenus TaxID=2482727 RepID=UPI001F3F7FF3|nr:c-type cytochrome [Mucilaginibacter terrenus]
MKKVFIVLGISLVIAACGGPKPGETEEGTADSANAAQQSAVAHQSDAAQDTAVSKIGTEKAAGTADNKGQQLMASLDCNTCHKEHEKVIGPAFADIAKKYTSADEEMLAKKVIAGGSGNWGTVPMTAHPDLKLEDAKEMVKYVLSVK